MLYIKNIMTKWLFSQSRKVTLVCTEDVDCTDNAQQIFSGKTINPYCSLWAGVVGFCSWFFVLAPHRRCCLCNEVTPTEEAAPLVMGFYNLQFTI
jgi:hypothetical protein